MRTSLPGRSVLGVVLALGPLSVAACVPGPGQLLLQMQHLDQVAQVASAKYKASCAAPNPSETQQRVCAQLFSCLTELQASARTCKDAISQGRTARDGDYTLQARDCEQAARVTVGICPGEKTPAAVSTHVP